MAQFDDRKKAFEAKFHKDQELQFKVTARRNKLLGLWAAEKMGIEGTDADAYAKEVVLADFEEPGDDDILRKVLGDLQGKGLDISEHAVRHEMDALMGEAKRQFTEE
ncbi:MAG: DUF1476 domain-containing protein [Proteobacteria bacterium]|nr:DUF1476 domain-containing protein [Pseudomonadota bacterium]